MLTAIARYHDHIYDDAYDAFASGTPTTKRIYDWLRHCWRVVDVIDVGRAPQPVPADVYDAPVSTHPQDIATDIDAYLRSKAPAFVAVSELTKELSRSGSAVRNAIYRRSQRYETKIETERTGAHIRTNRLLVRMKEGAS